MILTKQQRIKYFGFDDLWFTSIGAFLVSFLTNFLFNRSLFSRSLADISISWGIALFFTLFNWFVMRFIMVYLRKKYPAFQDNLKRIVLLFIALIVTVGFVDLAGNLILGQFFGGTYHPLERSRILLPIILISTLIQAIYEAIYFYIRLQKSIREEEQAKQLIVQAKLDALRNQAQPHFLFNSLNTLRDIIDQDPKEDAKNFVDKLADVYRFILEAGSNNLIPLQDELKFAKSYLHIQSERFGSNLKVDWMISAKVLDALIIPMSVQLLLENAIKHNVISKAKPLLIEIIDQDQQIVVINKLQPKSTQLPSTKLGLSNIEKRYSLISDRTIQISNDGDQFSVAIPLLSNAETKNVYASTDH